MAILPDRTELTTPADGDLYMTTDVSDTTDAATGTDKKITWANIKTALASVFAPALGADDNYVTDAEKAALHAAVTVSDSAEIDFTLTGQQITASLIAGSIDETKLDASVNASLDLADTALQDGDIAVAFPTYMFSSTNSDISGYEEATSLTSYVAGAEANNGGTAASTTPAIMEEFATAIGYPNLTLLPAGIITIHFETTKGAGANNYYCYAEVYKRVLAGTETLLATSDNSTLSALNTRVQQTVTATLSSNVTLLATDRIVVKCYVVMSSSTATVTLYYDDATNARIELPPVSLDATTLVTIATNQTITGTKTFTTLELGHATDTTISRSTAGVIAVEGIVIPSISSTNTLTNKRVTKRTGTTTSSATPTINTDNVDFYSLTAQTVDITSFTTNLSGTPTENQTLWIAITGTAARAITWGASFENGAVALPTTTTTTLRLDVGFVWNTVTSKWRCMATGSTV